MIKVTRLNAVTSWNRALNAARRTVGKSALKKEPSDSWKAKMLLAEHSPIRLVEYEWTWEQIPQWVTVHFTRHATKPSVLGSLAPTKVPFLSLNII